MEQGHEKIMSLDVELVALEGVSFSYKNKVKGSKLSSHLTLDNISFALKKGESLGIIGRNGSGKSTLAKLVAGIFEPDTGSVTKRGLIAPLIELGAGFEYELSAKENLYLYGLLIGLDFKLLKQNEDLIFEFAELSEKKNMPLRFFSSGMVARLGFAIATFLDPEILLIDEILSVGDKEFAAKSRKRIEQLIAKGSCTILVSHDFDAIRTLTEKCIWIENGKIIEFGNSRSVTDDYMLNVL